MAISQDEVRHIGRLARLTLTDGEVELYAKQLSEILEYVNLLDELDVEKVEPMSHVLDMVNVMREDKALPSLSREEVMKNAPDHDGTYFKVPRVIKS